MGARYFEDFAAGDRFVSPGKTLSEAEMLDFAFRFDPQPIHLDVEAARESPYGGLIASGFHTMVVGFRMLWQTGVFNACSLGSPGIDEVRWLKPVRPGDTLHTEAEVLEARPSSSKPDRGVCRVKYTVVNQTGEAVMTMTAVQILARRPTSSAEGPAP
ncbi:MAG: MaoC family dehydratase [Alphaproteobacteria bacterium]